MVLTGLGCGTGYCACCSLNVYIGVCICMHESCQNFLKHQRGEMIYKCRQAVVVSMFGYGKQKIKGKRRLDGSESNICNLAPPLDRGKSLAAAQYINNRTVKETREQEV